MLAGDFDEFGVEVRDEDLFFVVAGFGDDAAERVGDEAASPELEAGVRGVVAGAFEVDGFGVAVGGGALKMTSPYSWPTRLTAQTKTPLAMAWARCTVCQASYWAVAELVFFGGVPADGGGEEEDLGAAQGGEAGAFGVPLVPADQRTDGAVAWFRMEWKPRSPGVK